MVLAMASIKVYNTMVISIGIRILKHFLLGGLPQWPVDVIRVAQLPILGRLVGRSPALVGHREVVDEVPLHPIVQPWIWASPRWFHYRACKAGSSSSGSDGQEPQTQKATEEPGWCPAKRV